MNTDGITLITLIATVWKLVAFFGYLTSRVWKSALNQLTVWAAAFVVILLASAASLTKTIPISGSTFGALDAGSKLLVALVFGSTASAAYSLKQAVDHSDSAAEPAPFDAIGPTPGP